MQPLKAVFTSWAWRQPSALLQVSTELSAASLCIPHQLWWSSWWSWRAWQRPARGCPRGTPHEAPPTAPRSPRATAACAPAAGPAPRAAPTASAGTRAGPPGWRPTCPGCRWGKPWWKWRWQGGWPTAQLAASASWCPSALLPWPFLPSVTGSLLEIRVRKGMLGDEFHA